MNTINRVQAGQQFSTHEFSEGTSIFYKSLPENKCGWYFSDNNGALFGPIRDEITARQMLSQLSLWFKNRKSESEA